MADNWAEVARTQEYRKAVEFALNETPGKLKVLASQANYKGKKVQIEDRFDDLVATEIDERNGDTKNIDPNINRRWLAKPKRQAAAPLIDPDDMEATEVGLGSPVATQVAKAIRRAQDDRWLQGYYGTAITGEDGTVQVPFPAAQILPVDFSTTGTPTGLTLRKLIRMRRLLSGAFVDTETEKPIIPVTAAQIEDLLLINQVTSRDYNPQAQLALQNGDVADFMGFRFLPAEIGNPKAYPLGSALTVDANGYRLLPCFVPSGMHFGTWHDFQGSTDTRVDKNMSEQIWGSTCGGATRVLEAKCWLIRCLES